MKCKTCHANLNKNWRELVIDINYPQCGFCDGTILKLILTEGLNDSY